MNDQHEAITQLPVCACEHRVPCEPDGCHVSRTGHTPSSARGLAEPNLSLGLNYISDLLPVVQLRSSEMLAKMSHLVTPFIPGLLGRSQFLKSDSLTHTSSCVAMP